MRKALVALFFAIVGCSGQANATTQTTPTAVSDYGPPPAGVPLVYLKDPTHPGWYAGFDWSGNPRSTIRLRTPPDNLMNLVQAPDGSAFVTIGPKTGAGEFYDRVGNPVGSAPGFREPIWADDNRHMCGITEDTNGSWWDLATILPGARAQMVAQIIPFDANPVAPPGGGVSVIACSFVSGNAVLARDAHSGPTEFWVVQMSTGKLLVHRLLPPKGPIGTLVASPDGKLLVENSSQSVGFPGGTNPPHTFVVRADSGWVESAIDPAWSVLAFGPDNLTMLVTTSTWLSGFPTRLAVVDLSGQQILWQSDGTEELATYFAEPTHGFALVLKTPRAEYSHPGADVVLFDVLRGHAARLPADYQRP